MAHLVDGHGRLRVGAHLCTARQRRHLLPPVHNQPRVVQRRRELQLTHAVRVAQPEHELVPARVPGLRRALARHVLVDAASRRPVLRAARPRFTPCDGRGCRGRGRGRPVDLRDLGRGDRVCQGLDGGGGGRRRLG